MVMKIIKVCACHQHTVCGINQCVIGDEGNCHCRELRCVGWSMHCTVGGGERLQLLQTDRTAAGESHERSKVIKRQRAAP